MGPDLILLIFFGIDSIVIGLAQFFSKFGSIIVFCMHKIYKIYIFTSILLGVHKFGNSCEEKTRFTC